jgi:hypothetical protein
MDAMDIMDTNGRVFHGHKWTRTAGDVFFEPVHSSIKRQVHRVHSVHDVHSCPCPLNTPILPFEWIHVSCIFCTWNIV